MRVTWPCLKFMCCCFLKKKKKSFNLALKRAIRRKLNLAVPKSDQLIEDDPFLLLGYGMNSYFQVMVELMWMVGIITLVLAPIMMTFASFDALATFPGYDFNQYTLGNIGGSSAVCQQATFTGKYTALSIDCPAGTVIDLTAKAENTGAAIFDYGIIPSTADVNTYCMSSAFEDADNCSSYMNNADFDAKLNADCVGK